MKSEKRILCSTNKVCWFITLKSFSENNTLKQKHLTHSSSYLNDSFKWHTTYGELYSKIPHGKRRHMSFKNIFYQQKQYCNRSDSRMIVSFKRWKRFLHYWPFVRESTGGWRIPPQKASDVVLWCFLCCSIPRSLRREMCGLSILYTH